MVVGSVQIAAFLPLCESLARRMNGLGGSEYDDLRQEGMIAVWESLKLGFFPTSKHVENRMRNWIAYCRRKGFTGHEEKVDS